MALGPQAGSVSSARTVPAKTSARTLHPQPVLRHYYDALFAAHGSQHWWPGRTPFEIIVGAILVQNTSWTNVEPVIANLRREKLLAPRSLDTVPTRRLARLIRSSGYFRQKTKKLKAFVSFLRTRYQGSLARMFRIPTSVLRNQLLSIHGIGPETADSILLYAGGRPVFVVDTYTRRMLERHRLAESHHSYETIRSLFERSLPAGASLPVEEGFPVAADSSPAAALYNEFHALIVHTGKHFCRAHNPRCTVCPLGHTLPERTAVAP